MVRERVGKVDGTRSESVAVDNNFDCGSSSGEKMSGSRCARLSEILAAHLHISAPDPRQRLF